MKPLDYRLCLKPKLADLHQIPEAWTTSAPREGLMTIAAQEHLAISLARGNMARDLMTHIISNNRGINKEVTIITTRDTIPTVNRHNNRNGTNLMTTTMKAPHGINLRNSIISGSSHPNIISGTTILRIPLQPHRPLLSHHQQQASRSPHPKVW